MLLIEIRRIFLTYRVDISVRFLSLVRLFKDYELAVLGRCLGSEFECCCQILVLLGVKVSWQLGLFCLLYA